MTFTQVFLVSIYPAIVGVLLGILYYGGLWLTLRNLAKLRYPALWVSISLLLRTLAVVFVLYILFAKTWQPLLIALIGMLFARTVLVQRIRPGQDPTNTHTGKTS